MDNSEKISGEKIFGILEQVKNNHTILDIHVTGTGFNSLTIILDVSDGENPRFFIDYPGRIDSDTPFSAGKKCYFEFSNEDKIKYRFKATVDGILGKKIKFKFPEFIERSQRRKAFRIPAPSGSKLIYSNNNDRFELDILNVSEDGLLVSQKNKSSGGNIFFEGNILKNMSLSAGQKDNSIRINIGSAEIVRLETANESARINYGLRFTDIDKRERDELRRFIYYCQRKDLQKRGEFGY